MRKRTSNQDGLKVKELRWFQTSQELCPLFPAGEPDQPPSPAPDIRFQDLDLGIEITEYLVKQPEGGSPRRQLENLRDKVINEAKRVFETRSEEMLFVSVFWTPDRRFSSETRESLVKGIVKVVSNLLTQDEVSWRTPWRPDWEKSDDRILGQYIGEIWIARRGRGSSAWTCADGGAVGGDVQRLQATINGKEPNVAKYRGDRGSGIVWLLIVAEARISSYFSPDEDFDQSIFHTSFDRVFVLDVFRHQVRELRVEPL
jgi:hypothetical protein